MVGKDRHPATMNALNVAFMLLRLCQKVVGVNRGSGFKFGAMHFDAVKEMRVPDPCSCSLR